MTVVTEDEQKNCISRVKIQFFVFADFCCGEYHKSTSYFLILKKKLSSIKSQGIVINQIFWLKHISISVIKKGVCIFYQYVLQMESKYNLIKLLKH